MKKQNNSPEQTSAKKNGSSKLIAEITLKLLLISVVTALLLSAVNMLTKDTIAANQEAEKASAIVSIFSGDVEYKLYETPLEGISALYTVSAGGEAAGYAAEVAPMGFGGEMSLMVGVSADGKIVGIKLISHSETPGLGNRVGEDAHLSQYKDLTLGTMDGSVDVITGSTVSSNAVYEGVKAALSVHGTVFGGENAENDGGAK